jgi:hypothetical protein
VRVLVLGHYKAERLIRSLVAKGATEIVLWSDVNPGLEAAGASLQWLQMKRLATPENLLEMLHSVRPDITVANVLGEEEEHLILAYALAAKRRARPGQFPWHPPGFARPSVDKAALHRVATSLGLPVPDGDVAGQRGDVRPIVYALGGPPVILKEARAQALKGVYAAPDYGSLDAVLAKNGLRFPLLVQRMVTGEEIGIEVLSAGGQSCRFPVASLGEIDLECCPFARVRSMPRALPLPALCMVEKILDTIEDELRPHGPWQLDLALVDQEVMILEINGRLGGLSDMGLSVTGLDPHDLFGGLVTGETLPDPRPAAVALEIPVIPDAPLPAAGDDMQLECVPYPPAKPGLADSDYSRLSLRSADRAALGRWLDQLDPAALWTSPAALRLQVDRAFDGLQRLGQQAVPASRPRQQAQAAGGLRPAGGS